MNLGRLIRFGVVGGINTGIYYACYLALRTQIMYLLAHVCAFVVAMFCSYFLNCYITFRIRPSWRTFGLFPLSNATNFVLTTVGLRLAVGEWGLDQRIAPLLVAVVAIPITYVVTHYLMVGPLWSPDPPVGREAPALSQEPSR
jgi:putative flippase GtrA